MPISLSHGTHRFLCSRYERGSYFRLYHGRQTKTEDTTIKPILPTQTDWHEDTKLRALYQALPVLTAEQIYSATKVLRILVEHYFPFNDLVAEELPYEQLPDFVESEQPISRPRNQKKLSYT